MQISAFVVGLTTSDFVNNACIRYLCTNVSISIIIIIIIIKNVLI